MREDERKAREETLMCMASMIASGVLSGTVLPEEDRVATYAVSLARKIRALIEGPRP